MEFRARALPSVRLPEWAEDALLALALAVALVGVRAIETDGSHRAAGVGYALTILAALSLALRRRRPLAVFAATLTIALLSIAVASPTGAISLTVVIAIYTLAQLDRRPRALGLAVCAGVALALARGLLQYRGWSDARTAVEPALALAALFLGWAISSHRAYVAEIEARAAQAERTREEEARRRVDAERLRIARDLHDVLAHGIATINIQAGVAAHVLHDRPQHAEQALRTIKQTSGEALRELRGILGVLRQADESQPRAPAPGLGQLDALLVSTEHAGLPTRVSVCGQRRPLPAAVDLAAYRIVQEGLTNVLRHAGENARAVVEIAYADALVTVTVDDDDSGRAPDGDGRAPNRDGRGDREGRDGATDRSAVNGHEPSLPGHGITGMSERAHALGGELEAGPRADGGGFRVRARLPIATGAP
jgi:signal transduction histidine kinase